MKQKYFYTLTALSITLILAIAGCTRDWKDAIGAGPEITISDDYKSIKGINVGDRVTVPVTVRAQTGVKRLSYFFITKTANGTTSGAPVHIDRTDLPAELQQNISFTITQAMTELVIVSFNKENFSSEVHIPMSEIRQLPVITFKDNVKYQATVFENKMMKIEGQVTSAFDLQSITYKTGVNVTYSAETPITYT